MVPYFRETSEAEFGNHFCTCIRPKRCGSNSKDAGHERPKCIIVNRGLMMKQSAQNIAFFIVFLAPANPRRLWHRRPHEIGWWRRPLAHAKLATSFIA